MMWLILTAFYSKGLTDYDLVPQNSLSNCTQNIGDSTKYFVRVESENVVETLPRGYWKKQFWGQVS